MDLNGRLLFIWITISILLISVTSPEFTTNQTDFFLKWSSVPELRTSGMWSNLLEEWTISPQSEREGRAIQQIPQRYIPYTRDYQIKRRISDDCLYNNQINRNYNNQIRRMGKITDGFKSDFMLRKDINCNEYANNGAGVGGGGGITSVSETDLYLLAAIEKLVYRVDYLESRLQRTEQLVYYLMNGNKQHLNQQSSQSHTFRPENKENLPHIPITLQQQTIGQNPSPSSSTPTIILRPIPEEILNRDDDNNNNGKLCPNKYTKIGKNCYYFGVDKKVNWKTGQNLCKEYSGHLVELNTKNEIDDMMNELMTTMYLKGHNFWTGGLNPGLLWIWSSSARPINDNDTNNNQNNRTGEATNANKSHIVDISGEGRCLMLTYNDNRKQYEFNGKDCSATNNFMCILSKPLLENEV